MQNDKDTEIKTKYDNYSVDELKAALKNYFFFSGEFSDADMEEMIRLTDELIRKAGERIKKGDFAIDPKEIDGVNESCRYCPYFALCYMRYSDLKVISTKEVDEDA